MREKFASMSFRGASVTPVLRRRSGWGVQGRGSRRALRLRRGPGRLAEAPRGERGEQGGESMYL